MYRGGGLRSPRPLNRFHADPKTGLGTFKTKMAARSRRFYKKKKWNVNSLTSHNCSGTLKPRQYPELIRDQFHNSHRLCLLMVSVIKGELQTIETKLLLHLVVMASFLYFPWFIDLFVDPYFSLGSSRSSNYPWGHPAWFQLYWVWPGDFRWVTNLLRERGKV